ncbi:MAG TPA: hypothetical protein PKK12_14080 [Candidatus Aminicenantes bacterium]|nr:hypothetical protein [Candidatus Aminicenantes bacterium]
MNGAEQRPAERVPAGAREQIVHVIDFLDRRLGIRFFVTPHDFHLAWHWWEKGIPWRVVEEALRAVCARWEKRGKKPDGLRPFAAEVRKRYREFLELRVGEGGREEPESDPLAPWNSFLEAFPEPLTPFRQRFADLVAALRENRPWSDGGLKGEILATLEGDGELAARTEVFVRQLAPELRRPALLATFRWNLVCQRFAIPPLPEEEKQPG